MPGRGTSTVRVSTVRSPTYTAALIADGRGGTFTLATKLAARQASRKSSGAALGVERQPQQTVPGHRAQRGLASDVPRRKRAVGTESAIEIQWQVIRRRIADRTHAVIRELAFSGDRGHGTSFHIDGLGTPGSEFGLGLHRSHDTVHRDQRSAADIRRADGRLASAIWHRSVEHGLRKKGVPHTQFRHQGTREPRRDDRIDAVPGNGGASADSCGTAPPSRSPLAAPAYGGSRSSRASGLHGNPCESARKSPRTRTGRPRSTEACEERACERGSARSCRQRRSSILAPVCRSTGIAPIYRTHLERSLGRQAASPFRSQAQTPEPERSQLCASCGVACLESEDGDRRTGIGRGERSGAARPQPRTAHGTALIEWNANGEYRPTRNARCPLRAR